MPRKKKGKATPKTADDKDDAPFSRSEEKKSEIRKIPSAVMTELQNDKIPPAALELENKRYRLPRFFIGAPYFSLLSAWPLFNLSTIGLLSSSYYYLLQLYQQLIL